MTEAARRAPIRGWLRWLLLATALLAPLAIVSTAQAASTHYAIAKPAACHTTTGPDQAMCMLWHRVTVSKGTRGARPFKYGSGATAAGTVGPAGGMTPYDLQTAYGPDRSGSSGETVAIVDAYNDPNIQSDLATFDSDYGLSCNSCLQVVNQTGGTTLPSNDNQGWSIEESLDVESVHSVCPLCKILLVEANSDDDSSLAAAENEAAALGASEITNSFGEPEGNNTTSFQSAFNHPGIVVTASTGDDGYYSYDQGGAGGPDIPSAYSSVVAVGGTSLYLNSDGSRSSETVWNDNGPQDDNFGGGATGGGCSMMFAAPAWQTAVSDWAATDCGTYRLAADVSAVADPYTGFDLYDSYDYGGGAPGWATYGGTSLASPIIAATYALVGGAQGAQYPAKTLYTNINDAYDVTSGGNGYCDGESAAECGSNPNEEFGTEMDCAWDADGNPTTNTLACDAAPGYDGPSGVGTPKTVAMFKNPGFTTSVSITGSTAPYVNSSTSWTADLVDSLPGADPTYTWSWGDGTHSTTTSDSAPHAYSTQGDYTIQVTATDAYGYTATNTYPVDATTPSAAPVVQSAPTISGTAAVGQTLTLTQGIWSNGPTSIADSWERCDSSGGSCVATGDTTPTYTVSSADVGHTLLVAETATNSVNTSSPSDSAPTAVVPAVPVAVVSSGGGGQPSGGGQTSSQSSAARAALTKLLTVSGSSGRIASILKHGGYQAAFTAPSAGGLVISWTWKSAGKHAKPVTVARATVTFMNSGTVKFKIALTKAGRNLLSHSSRLRMTIRATFTPSGQSAIVVTKQLTLKR